MKKLILAMAVSLTLMTTITAQKTYTVEKEQWLDEGNSLLKNESQHFVMTVKGDTMITNVPLLTGILHTKYRVLSKATYDFTGGAADVYGTPATTLDVIDILSHRRLTLIISTWLTVKVD